jgi:hypothetical protein
MVKRTYRYLARPTRHNMVVDSHPGVCSFRVRIKVMERVCDGVGWALTDQDGVLPSSYVV